MEIWARAFLWGRKPVLHSDVDARPLNLAVFERPQNALQPKKGAVRAVVAGLSHPQRALEAEHAVRQRIRQVHPRPAMHRFGADFPPAVPDTLRLLLSALLMQRQRDPEDHLWH